MSQSVSQTETRPFVSPDDYLRLEGEAVEKHEYYYGEVRAMAEFFRKFAHGIANLVGSVEVLVRDRARQLAAVTMVPSLAAVTRVIPSSKAAICR